jgi:hypothetical protein
MAPQIDFMIRTGLLSEDAGRNHPDRSCLTSVLGGEDIPRIDCPAEPFELLEGDILIAASDGIQYLSFPEIEDVLLTHSDKSSRWIADALLSRLEAHGDPEQDNASFSVVKVVSRPRRAASWRLPQGGRPGGRGRGARLRGPGDLAPEERASPARGRRCSATRRNDAAPPDARKRGAAAGRGASRAVASGAGGACGATAAAAAHLAHPGRDPRPSGQREVAASQPHRGRTDHPRGRTAARGGPLRPRPPLTLVAADGRETAARPEDLGSIGTTPRRSCGSRRRCRSCRR